MTVRHLPPSGYRQGDQANTARTAMRRGPNPHLYVLANPHQQSGYPIAAPSFVTVQSLHNGHSGWRREWKEIVSDRAPPGQRSQACFPAVGPPDWAGPQATRPEL